MRRRHVVVVGIVLLLFVAGWVSYDRSRSTGDEPRDGTLEPSTSAGTTLDRALDEERATGKEAISSKEARSKRDALRREIVRHVPSSPAPTNTPAGSTTDPKDSDPKRSSKEGPQKEPEPQPTDLRNKMGPGREQLGSYLNKEFSPLVAECVEQAEARSPELSGMFAISIETLAHEELGAVVDVADPASSNEVSEPVFFECIRESAFTLIIPPPLTTGQEKFELNGWFGPQPPSEPEPTGAAP